MLTGIARGTREPRLMIAILWPIVLLVPYLPGPPRPSLGGLPWRQEITLALLLTLTLTLIFRRLKPGDSNLTNGIDASHKFLIPAAGLFTLWIGASMLWAANPFSAAHYAFTWAAYVVFFVLMRMVATRPRVLRASIYALGTVVWLLSISCLVEVLGGSVLTDHEFRLTAKPLFRGFSGFSEMMAVVTPIFAGLALDTRKPRRAVLCGATSLIAWLATLQALERAPILGAVAGLLFLAIGTTVSRRFHPRSLQRAGLLLAAFAIITVLQIVPLMPADSTRDRTALERFQTTSVTEPNTSARLLFWGVGWEMFRAHPLMGVGANNYEIAFPQARAQFSALNTNSPLVGLNEHLLTRNAHNEYVQILAELGGVGLLLFLIFCLALILTFWRAVTRARRPLLVLGSGAGLFAFAVSSGASAFSFRWLGSGLVFFFAAALVSHFASTGAAGPSSATTCSPTSARMGLMCPLVFSVVILVGAGAQGTASVMHAWAQSNPSSGQAERFYRLALLANRFDAGSHFNYGSFLYHQRRPGEAISHLRYAVANGINTSTSYASLAAAEEQAGDLEAAEQTLAYATSVYPNSVFLLVRHAAALTRLGRTEESDSKFSEALLVDSRTARGWYQLINFDIDAAMVAASQDTSIAKPGELLPQNGVFVVLKENERRLNIPTGSGWRGRMLSGINR